MWDKKPVIGGEVEEIEVTEVWIEENEIDMDELGDSGVLGSHIEDCERKEKIPPILQI